MSILLILSHCKLGMLGTELRNFSITPFGVHGIARVASVWNPSQTAWNHLEEVYGIKSEGERGIQPLG